MMLRMFGLLLLLLSSTTVSAFVNLAVTGPPVNNPIGVFPFQPIAIPFTVGQAYTHLGIEPNIIGNFTGIAYLMTKIGPGASPSDEVASNAFTSSGGSFGTFQTVLQDVTIASAGTYFIVLSTTQVTPPQGLMETNFPIVVADAGNSYGALMAASVIAGSMPFRVEVDFIPGWM